MSGENPVREHPDEPDGHVQDREREGPVGIRLNARRNVVRDVEEHVQSHPDDQRHPAQQQVQGGAAPDGLVEFAHVAVRHVLREVADRRHGHTEHQEPEVPGDRVDQVPSAVPGVAELVKRERSEKVGRYDGDERDDPIAADTLEHALSSLATEPLVLSPKSDSPAHPSAEPMPVG